VTLPAPSGRPGAALLDFWVETRLRAADSKATSRKPAPGAAVSWRTALADVLDVGYGVHPRLRWRGSDWERVYRRTTPSAGALYPFEAFLATAGDGLHLWRIAEDDPGEPAARLIRLDAPRPSRESLASLGLAAPGDRAPVQAVLLLAARPWASMHKYYRRGYAYCHLDVGHAATNLALYAAALGLAPTVHLRFDRREMTAAFGLDGLCREPVAALAFRGPSEAPTIPRTTGDGVSLDPPGERERRAWVELRGVLSLDAPIDSIEPAAPPAAAAPLAPPEPLAGPVVALPSGRPAPATAREWRAASLARRSAKGFLDRPLTLAELGEILAAARGPVLATDAGADAPFRLGARVLARRVAGTHGVFAYSADDHSLLPVAPEVGDPGPACMHQEVARRASVMLVLHAPIGRWIEEYGWSAFAETHFRAAEIAQRLYLAAARLLPVGLTCIGGFDSDECSVLAGLPDGEEAIYVVLLGVSDEEAVKHDRVDVAYSHGRTSSEARE
jgi:SagB-type dehydrogenase family enzyme